MTVMKQDHETKPKRDTAK